MIIGSTAIKNFFPDFPREPQDIDIIKSMYIEKYNSDTRIEWLENHILKNWFTKPIEICTPNELYTLKISHCFWDLENNSWDKHMWDIQWLKEKGCKFIPELFYQLYSYWETVHGKNKRSDLNMSSEKFFDNVVNYPREHDLLHEMLVQHDYFDNKIPTYKKILKDGAEVDVSEEKFNKLAEKEKFNLVIEEIMVMSLERYGDMYYKKAFVRMLKKFILSHCPIWEGIWIIQNHKKLITNIPFDYLEFLNKKIKKIKI